jgi:signal transduction histidine kinase
VTLNDGVQLLTQAVILAIALATARDAVRRPTRAHLDVALLFGTMFVVIAFGRLGQVFGIDSDLVRFVALGAALAIPYLSVRLAHEYAGASRVPYLAAGAGYAVGLLLAAFASQSTQTAAFAYAAAYFVIVQAYAAYAFLRAGSSAGGVTRRRLLMVGLGSLLLGAAALASIGFGLWPAAGQLFLFLMRLLALATALAYFFGFAPPRWVRRAWQEPELRAFLGRAAAMTRLPDTGQIVREIERATAKALGAPRAALGLWDEAAGVLRFDVPATGGRLASGELVAGRAFAAQAPTYSADAARDFPNHAAEYAWRGVRAVAAAPITAGTARLGVLTVHADRASLFAEDDLALVQLLADQAAIILESRALIDEAARVRAETEANRLREDFLSAAAHDLRTPLTALVGYAQLLQRRAERSEVPREVLQRELARILGEVTRLRRLVLDLLDASRVEQGSLIGRREPVDLAALAVEQCERHTTDHHPCELEADAPVVLDADAGRVEQLLDNLIGNAVKYSPDGGPVKVRVWTEDGSARMSVGDRGIGVPAPDLPYLFDRFRRGGNVDDRRFAGLGLGLYICRGIAEGHGGRIWAESTLGEGTTIQVELPLRPATGLSH